YGRLAARCLGIPAVHTFHGIHYSSYSTAGQALYLVLERRLSRLSHAIINVSTTQEVEGLALDLFDRDQSVGVPNGIHVHEMDGIIAQSSLSRDMLGLTADDFVIGCISRWDPVKRIEILLQALERLSARRPRLALLLVGGGGEEPRIRELVALAGLQDQV